MRHFLLTTLAISSYILVHAADLTPSNVGERELVRRQVYGAPLYSPCGPAGCAPGPCQSPLCMPAAAPALPPLPPPPAPVCSPACVPPATCMGPALGCAPPPMPMPAPAVYAPIPPPPPVPPPTAGRLIPQALPGAPCEPGVECTGGSVCSMGICLCPPELVQEGTVCVSRTIYGVVPGAPAPPPPMPVPAFAPMPMPLPVRPAYYDPCIIKRSAGTPGSNADCKES